MKYKFVDIGCCFFETSVDEFGLDVDGLLVEPIKEACDVLPYSDKVKIVNVAISDYNGTGELTVPEDMKIERYIPREEMLGKYDQFPNAGIIGGSTLQEPLTFNYHNIKQKKIECKIISFYDLCEQYNITEIDYLRIDTEGHEPVILKQVLDMMQNNKLTINCELAFEYNYLSDNNVLDNFAESFSQFGFRHEIIHEGWNKDIVLTKFGIDLEKDAEFKKSKILKQKEKVSQKTNLLRQHKARIKNER